MPKVSAIQSFPALTNSAVRPTDVDAFDHLRDLQFPDVGHDKVTLIIGQDHSYDLNHWSYVQDAAESRLLYERRLDGLSTGRFAPAMSTTTKVYRVSLLQSPVCMRPMMIII